MKAILSLIGLVALLGSSQPFLGLFVADGAPVLDQVALQHKRQAVEPTASTADVSPNFTLFPSPAVAVVESSTDLPALTSTSSSAPTATRTGSYRDWRNDPFFGDRDTRQATTAEQAETNKAPIISIVIVALVAVILCVMFALRIFFVLRYYHPSVRAFFIPIGGLHINFFKIHISGATPKPPTGPPPRYSRGRHAHINTRHHRGTETRGEGIREGGRRIGTRDQDDSWDGEEASIDGSEPTTDEEKEGLPSYAIDVNLPGYDYSRATGGTRNSSNDTPTALAATRSNETRTSSNDESRSDRSSEEGEPRMLSAQEYEAATRNEGFGPDTRVIEMRQITPTHATPLSDPSSQTPASTDLPMEGGDLSQSRS